MRFQILNTLALGALVVPLGVQALPAISDLIPRQLMPRGGYQGVAMLIADIIEYLKDRNAYDSDVPDKCILSMWTTAGGNCQTYLDCGKGQFELPGWNVCYLNGRQFFSNDDLGDFSITYTQAGGVDGNNWDGLHNPIVQLADLNNWENIDVQSIIDQQEDLDTGKLCKLAQYTGQKNIIYTCGLPKKGTAGFGMSNFPPPSSDPGYTPGWCTMHVVQHQRNENGVGADYEFDVIIYDAAKKEIGDVQLAPIDANSKSLSVSSQLPYMVVVTAPGGDADPVQFAYGGDTWKSGDGSHQSNLGDGHDNGYENGNREGDMGFNC